jgi:hypothetical protein
MADSPEEKEKKLSSMSNAVKVVIDMYPVGHRFHGNELKGDVVKIYPDAANMYPDTILRMARRHRRYAFKVADQNNSLYEKVKTESILEQIKKVIPIPPPAECSQTPVQLALFSHVFFTGFFAVFFVVFLGAFFALESGYGRPLFPPSFIASKSASVYNPAEPIYLNGSLPFLLNRIFTAADEVFNRCAISNTVIPSISTLYRKTHTNQVLNAEMLQHFNDSLHGRIVKNQLFCKFCKNSFQNLDNSLGQGYTVYMLQHSNI